MRVVCALLLLLAIPAAAHNPDTSYARCIIAGDRVEVRLTYDVFTLQMITLVDVDNDQRVTREELRRATPTIQKFLRASVHLEIEGQSTELGTAGEPLWPGETGEGLGAPDWHTAAGLITFPFRQGRTQAAREVALNFELFQTLTSQHTVLGSFEHGEQKEEVSFTEAEPDYLFDATYVNVPAVPSRSPSPSNGQRPHRSGVLSLACFFVLALIAVLWLSFRLSSKANQ